MAAFFTPKGKCHLTFSGAQRRRQQLRNSYSRKVMFVSLYISKAIDVFMSFDGQFIALLVLN